MFRRLNGSRDAILCVLPNETDNAKYSTNEGDLKYHQIAGIIYHKYKSLPRQVIYT
jgi:hypothetical protein